MRQFNPFRDIPCSYGAPMGRRGDNPSNLRGVRRLCARWQGGRDGYDRGGAYWGTPSDVWGVWARVNGAVCCAYVRAKSRSDAIEQVRGGIE